MRSIAIALMMLFAVTAQAEEVPKTFTVNVALYSQYVFRGLAQTNEKPAIQGGADYVHPSGVYAGTWLSNASWFADTNPGNSSSLEWDLYAGWKTTWDGGFAADVGYVRYQYPGSYPLLPLGAVKPYTDEAYVGWGWRWIFLKYSYAFSDLFGVENSDGSDYLDLTVTIPFGKRLTVSAHAARQGFRGTSGAARRVGATNDEVYAYEDYRASVTYTFANGWSAQSTYTRSNARDVGYTILGKNIGDDHWVVGLTRNF